MTVHYSATDEILRERLKQKNPVRPYVPSLEARRRFGQAQDKYLGVVQSIAAGRAKGRICIAERQAIVNELKKLELGDWMITYIGQTRHAGVYFSMEYTGADDLGVAKASVQFAKWSEVQRPMFDDFC